MDLPEIMKTLENFGNEQTVKIFKNHGAKEPLFGVKIGDLKKIVKKTKKNHALSQALYATGNSDAMYLACLIADEKQVDKQTLQSWMDKASWYMISEYAVASVAAETPFAKELADEWINNNSQLVAGGGWSTYTNLLSIKPNEDINITDVKDKLAIIQKTIGNERNRVKYTMNGFVIAAGCYIPELTDFCIELAEKIGKVDVYIGNTSCKVPYAPSYIQKTADKNRIGVKRKAARC